MWMVILCFTDGPSQHLKFPPLTYLFFFFARLLTDGEEKEEREREKKKGGRGHLSHTSVICSLDDRTFLPLLLHFPPVVVVACISTEAIRSVMRSKCSEKG